MNDDKEIIHGVLNRGQSCSMIGPPKCGMSWLALQMATSVSGGDHWFGFETEPRKVLFIDLELSIADIYTRLDKLKPSAVCMKNMDFASDSTGDVATGAIFGDVDRDLLIIDGANRLPELTGKTDIELWHQINAQAEECNCAIVLVQRTSNVETQVDGTPHPSGGCHSSPRVHDVRIFVRPTSFPSMYSIHLINRQFPSTKPILASYANCAWSKFVGGAAL